MSPRWRRRGGAAPLATVVIPTWSWPEALGLSLRSALAQTERRIEVIVASDGPDAAAAQVAADVRDRRVRFIALPERTGSQSGPNNAAIAAARTDRIAYLGHDDLWHPEHIACLLDAANRTRADVVHSGILLLGPEGSGARLLAGIDPSPEWWVPPSSTMHSRGAVVAAGGWRSDHADGIPVDADLQRRIDASGATRALTGRVTAVKFPASWRPDAYGTRDVAQQRAALAALGDDPAWLERQVVGAAADMQRQGARRVGKMPDGGWEPVAAEVLRVRRYKGADQGSSIPVEAHWRPEAEHLGADWHPYQVHDDGTPYAWTGPGTRSSAILHVSRECPLVVEIRVLMTMAPDILDTLDVELDGETVPAERASVGDGARLLLRAPAAPGGSRLRLTFVTSRTSTPNAVFGTDDHRPLGVAVAWIVARPASSFAPPL